MTTPDADLASPGPDAATPGRYLVEIIGVRLLEFAYDQHLQEAYAKLCHSLPRQPGRPLEMGLYQNPLVEGDWTLHLWWPFTPPPRRSQLGLGLAQSLMALGQVHHTLWLPWGAGESVAEEEPSRLAREGSKEE